MEETKDVASKQKADGIFQSLGIGSLISIQVKQNSNIDICRRKYREKKRKERASMIATDNEHQNGLDINQMVIRGKK